MPHWISETIMAIVNFVPALFVAEDSPNFPVARMMIALLFIVLVVYLIAMRPFRPTRYDKADSNHIEPKP